MGTSGGNHAQCFDIGEHGTRTCEGSGTGNHESHRRKSRMVAISLSGSGEGPGWETSRPTLQRHFATDRVRLPHATLLPLVPAPGVGPHPAPPTLASTLPGGARGAPRHWAPPA